MSSQAPAGVLALNAGSSSLKFGLFHPGEPPRARLAGTVKRDGDRHWIDTLEGDRLDGGDQLRGQRRQGPLLPTLLELVGDAGEPPPAAIGHRLVHGGPALREHRLVDEEVLGLLEQAGAFAPLHVPQALALVREAREAAPDIPNAACLDTAFHRDLPELARTLPLPAGLRAEGIERYGFHGLSCESIVAQLGAELPARLAVAHLGSGASVTAIRAGRSVDTSMGLTPTGGMLMATRPGDLDPGIALYLLRERGYDAARLEALLEHQSGLLGLSGLSADVRELEERAAGHAGARLALEQFALSAARQVAAMALALGGLDLLVFTGGIGEHDRALREAVVRRLAPLLPGLDARALPSRENERIAAHTFRLLRRQAN
jgi:acetate kinase